MFNVQCLSIRVRFVLVIIHFRFYRCSFHCQFRLNIIYRTILRLIYVFNPFHLWAESFDALHSSDSRNWTAFGYLHFTYLSEWMNEWLSHLLLFVYTRFVLVLMLLREHSALFNSLAMWLNQPHWCKTSNLQHRYTHKCV